MIPTNKSTRSISIERHESIDTLERLSAMYDDQLVGTPGTPRSTLRNRHLTAATTTWSGGHGGFAGLGLTTTPPNGGRNSNTNNTNNRDQSNRLNSTTHNTNSSHSNTIPWSETHTSSISSVSSTTSSSLSNSLVPVTLIPINREPTDLDRRVRDVLALVEPSVTSDKHRQRVYLFVDGLIRRSLGAHTFRTSSRPASTYLPDDRMSISIFLCSGQVDKWFVKVNEMLC